MNNNRSHHECNHIIHLYDLIELVWYWTIFNNSTIIELKSITLIFFSYSSNLFVEKEKREKTFYNFSLRHEFLYAGVFFSSPGSEMTPSHSVHTETTWKVLAKRKGATELRTAHSPCMREKCATLEHANLRGHIANFRTSWYLSILIIHVLFS